MVGLLVFSFLNLRHEGLFCAHAGTCSGLAGAVVRLAIHITRCATASDKISGHMYMACTLVYPMASAAFFGDPPRRSIAFCLFMRHIVKQFTSAL